MPTKTPLHHKKGKPSTQITVRLTEEEHAVLKKHADKRNISVPDLLTEIVENLVS